MKVQPRRDASVQSGRGRAGQRLAQPLRNQHFRGLTRNFLIGRITQIAGVIKDEGKVCRLTFRPIQSRLETRGFLCRHVEHIALINPQRACGCAANIEIGQSFLVCL